MLKHLVWIDEGTEMEPRLKLGLLRALLQALLP